MKKCLVFLCLMVVVFFCTSSSAALIFKITSDQTVLTVNQTTTIHVWGWADDPAAAGTNGLVDWDLSMVVDNGGIVEITKDINLNGDITILAPSPFSMLIPNWNYGSVNAGKSGQVGGVNALRNPDDSSTTGIGDYSELFRFNVKAIAEGTVVYSMSNMIGDLADFQTAFDSGNGTAVLNVSESSNVLTVVPEPATLMLLSGFGILGFLTRRKR